MCSPDITLDDEEINAYESLEVYTNVYDASLEDYLVSNNTYGRVPCEIIDKIIKNHGGIDIRGINKIIKSEN